MYHRNRQAAPDVLELLRCLQLHLGVFLVSFSDLTSLVAQMVKKPLAMWETWV